MKVSKSNKAISIGESQISSIRHAPSTEYISVPSFLLKTYEIVDDASYDDIIGWNEQGDGFEIRKPNEFCEQILPVYFKHKNLSSFIRQLNLYGFHKTKDKNNEQCFAHVNFMKDDKQLLLKMRRRTKANEKKHNDPYIRSSEVMKMFSEMNDKIAEQENKINSLIQTNREFKNSVLALYTELEKSKEREKMISERQIGQLFNAASPGDNIKDFKPENTYRCSKEEMMNLFKAFVEKFIQNFNPSQMKNMFFDNNMNNFNYYSRPAQRKKSNAHEVLPFDIQNHIMLENGPLMSHDSMSDFSDKIGRSLRKRDSKRGFTKFEGYDSLKKVSEIKSVPSSPRTISRKDLAIGYNRNAYENSGLFLSRDNSVISELDHNKHIDNLSLNSHQKFDEFLADEKITKPLPNFSDHHIFEVRSGRSKSDVSSVKSIGNFNSSNKLSGKKRKNHPS